MPQSRLGELSSDTLNGAQVRLALERVPGHKTTMAPMAQESYNPSLSGSRATFLAENFEHGISEYL